MGWIAKPGAVAALLACAFFPLAWNRLAPALEAEAVHLELTPPPDGALERSPDVQRAERLPLETRRREERATFRFELERGGRYSVYGTSSHRAAKPLTLSVNGRPVSAMAFFQRTGSLDADFERHLLARGAHFTAGENQLSLEGEGVVQRALLLELRREQPLSPLRYAALSASLAVLLALRRALVTRVVLPPRARLAVASCATLGALAALPWLAYRVSDGHLAALGEKDPSKSAKLRELEAYLGSDAHRARRDGAFSVFVMGDSTHDWSLPPEHRMLPVLRRALPEDLRERVEIYGFSGGALNAFDFYLLLNRIVDERPDLVIVPVSLRSFSDHWLHDPGYRFHGMERYVSAAEFVRASSLAVAGRRLAFSGWLLRRVDAALFDGRAEDTLRGAKILVEREGERLAGVFTARFMGGWEPAPAGAAAEPERERWNTRIPPDHELFGAFRRINSLAARHGIEVLYYSEQVNVEAQRARGRDLRVRENFAVIRAELAAGGSAGFLMLSQANPPEVFSDHVDHYTPRGIAALGRRLADEIAARARVPRGAH